MAIECCAICLDDMTEPAALSCGHVFCKECIDQYTTTTRRQGRNRCPTCRTEYTCRPIKLFMQSSEDERPQRQPRQKTWAEATIPVPLFAELHVKNLRADLTTAQSILDSTQRQLELAQAEKRQLMSQSRRVIMQRDTANRYREDLIKENKRLKAERTVYFAAGRELEVNLGALRLEAEKTQRELESAAETIRQLHDQLQTRDKVGSGLSNTHPIAGTGPIPNPIVLSDDRNSSGLAHGAQPSKLSEQLPVTSSLHPSTHDNRPPLPASMSLEEILAGGLRKYRRS